MNSLLNIELNTLMAWIVNNNSQAVLGNIRQLYPNALPGAFRVTPDSYINFLYSVGSNSTKSDMGGLIIRTLSVPIVQNAFHAQELAQLQQQTGLQLKDILRHIVEQKQGMGGSSGTQQVAGTTANELPSTSSSNFIFPASATPNAAQNFFINSGLIGGNIVLLLVVLWLLRALVRYLTK